MHDIRLIRENPDNFDAAMARRSLPPVAQTIIEYDAKLRMLRTKTQEAEAERNAISRTIGEAARQADIAYKIPELKAQVAELKTRIDNLSNEENVVQDQLQQIIAALPNAPHDSVPDGVDETMNVEVRRYGTPQDISNPLPHDTLGESLGGMDFEAAAKLSGSRFVVLRGEIARLDRALGQFMLDLHTKEHGYTEVAPPLLVRDEVMFGTAQLPKFRDDQFHVGAGNADPYLWLVPTAEVPLTNLVRESIIDATALPLRFTAMTPCFRAEAGAAGRDTRGMLRQHQFNKVELVSITAPEDSAAELERLTSCAEKVLQKLELPFRTIVLCSGDMGFAAQKTYDIEVWMPAQKTYREISSCSNCGDFQARRMAARYRPIGSKNNAFVHTLNGSGVAVGRCLIAVMENYQQPDGSIAVPDVLVDYMGGQKAIGKK